MVPEALAVALPDAVSDELGAGLGIPGITAHRAVFADGSVRDRTLLVHAPDGVDRVVEVAFSDDVDLDAGLLRLGGVLAAYATRDDRPAFPFWPMLSGNVTIRLLAIG